MDITFIIICSITIFNLYLEGNLHQKIANILNEEKVLGRTNWLDSTIQKILSNELYKGDFVHGKRQKNPTYYENVVESIVSKETWKNYIISKSIKQAII